MSWKFGYARVSREGQTPEQQITALIKAGVERENIFVETASGANEKRPELKKMLEKVRKDDTIVIWKLDRLARSMRHLMDIADDLKARGIHLHSLTDAIDTSTASGQLMFHVLGALAQFERSLIIERTNAGLARAREAGRIGGRQKTDQAKLDVAFANIGRGLSQEKACKVAGISRSTLVRAMREAKTSEEEKRHIPEKDATNETVKRRMNGSKPHLAAAVA